VICAFLTVFSQSGEVDLLGWLAAQLKSLVPHAQLLGLRAQPVLAGRLGSM